MKKHLKNILFILIVSISITFIFFFLAGGSADSLKSIFKNVSYGLIIGIAISSSGFISKSILSKVDKSKNPMRIYVLLLSSVILYISIVVISINLFWYTFVFGLEFHEVIVHPASIIITILTIFIGLVIYFIILSKRFLIKVLDAEKEIHKTKQEADKSKYETLKAQINPHFLFNSLNTLISLVYTDASKADEYTTALSKIYRYILENQDKDLVQVKDEIAFIKKYSYLQSIRFDNNFELNIEKNSNFEECYIVPISLQILFENIFKHNIVSESKKIVIRISFADNYITVSNNMNKKDTAVESYNVGLKNITGRFKLHTNRECIINQTEHEFSVKLPLICDNLNS